jgi:hypothetical protein
MAYLTYLIGHYDALPSTSDMSLKLQNCVIFLVVWALEESSRARSNLGSTYGSHLYGSLT